MAINFADERVLKSQRALSLLPADSNTNPEVFWKAYFLLKLSKSVQVIPFKEQQTTPWNIGQMHYFLVWHKWSGRFCYLHGELIKSPNLEMSHAIYGKQFGLAVAKRSPDQKSKATTRMEGNKAWSRSNNAPFWTGVQTDKKPGACGFEFHPSERRCRNSVQKRQCYRHRLKTSSASHWSVAQKEAKTTQTFSLVQKTLTWPYGQATVDSRGWKTYMSS